jgi:hypothetical protein
VYSIWISLSSAGSGVSRSPSLLSGVSSVSTRNAEGPGHCGSVLITEEVDGVGDKVRSTTAVVHKCFEASFNVFLRSASAAKVSDLDLNKFFYNTFPMFFVVV